MHDFLIRLRRLLRVGPPGFTLAERRREPAPASAEHICLGDPPA